MLEVTHLFSKRFLRVTALVIFSTASAGAQPQSPGTGRFAPAPDTSTSQARPPSPNPLPSTQPPDQISADHREAYGRAAAEKSEVRFGLIAPFSGANKEFGHQLAIGVETAFNTANNAGGIGAYRLKLVTADDGYEPSRTPELVRRMAEQDGVVGFVGNFGTPTAAAILPWVLDHKLLFFGAYTGSNLVRAVPPDRYVFNYRPSYAEETEAVVRYLVNVRGLKPREIVVFAQDDPFGEAGYAGVLKALRTLQGRYELPPQKLTYKRNTIDVAGAVTALRARKTPPKAIVMVALYRAAAEFIKLTRPLYPQIIYTDVSAVGATALAEELALIGPKVGEGVLVTQVVPAVGGYSKAVLDFKAQLARYFPGEKPDYVSFEAYIDAKIVIEAIRRIAATPGTKIDGDRLADALEGLGTFDMGLGTTLGLGLSEHQASHMIWGTQLDETGKFVTVGLQ
ncbi:ABC transporter substrate-binding protein [Methylobacterium sp. E-065]|uniref:ABC transporter substrate-binding protein n=1 Tax=Methylobacterium sp. E-065 TaxID=2836583 RepID=UPI001FBAE378|nr:ABC transporter substrate-binding protein [Methylobacterium sp. E-065]MCJ2021935.1 ABC transporter substrate-binding protein [Methylobacterium sp. E-065]